MKIILSTYNNDEGYWESAKFFGWDEITQDDIDWSEAISLISQATEEYTLVLFDKLKEFMEEHEWDGARVVLIHETTRRHVGVCGYRAAL